MDSQHDEKSGIEDVHCPYCMCELEETDPYVFPCAECGTPWGLKKDGEDYVFIDEFGVEVDAL